MRNQIRKMLCWMPVSWKARIEFLFDKSLGKEFGGPFNGQEFRQGIFKDLVSTYSFRAIVETGSFRGVTTEFMATESGLPVYTVEAESRFFHYAKLALRKNKKVKVILGDSRQFIVDLSKNKSFPKDSVFFYLDAHWHDDLPLFREIELVGANWTNTIIMIDDFEVPDDTGYNFDDYGGGKRLNLDYIFPLLENKWVVFFPSAKSDLETSIKRGCVVLVSKDLEDTIKQVTTLRIYNFSKSDVAK